MSGPVFLLVGVVLGFLMGLGLMKLLRLLENSKPLVAFRDPDTSRVIFRRVHPDAKGEVLLGKGEKRRKYILEGQPRAQSNLGAFWEVNAKYGWNYVFPGRREADEDARLVLTTISDPYTYAQAEVHNDAQDSLRANTDKPHWAVALAPFAIIGLVIIMVMIGVLMAMVKGAL